MDDEIVFDLNAITPSVAVAIYNALKATREDTDQPEYDEIGHKLEILRARIIYLGFQNKIDLN